MTQCIGIGPALIDLANILKYNERKLASLHDTAQKRTRSASDRDFEMGPAMEERPAEESGDYEFHPVKDPSVSSPMSGVWTRKWSCFGISVWTLLSTGQVGAEHDPLPAHDLAHALSSAAVSMLYEDYLDLDQIIRTEVGRHVTRDKVILSV